MEEEILNTSGFYKNDNGDLLYGTTIYGPYEQYLLLREEKDNYTYPIDGWVWFNSEKEAKTFFLLE
jgi:hypothetical protein